ncbi:hypothetical protein SASPL_128950 [Salvia splendens]|uniref:Nuclear pore complex protein Nup188 n=1 Tax=Salvia splendens TaxID=180675 RepID=A0A8X8ZN09_SALSN|nr:hypothetical protein SASPL_128950 [Salvia splendens]
MASTAPATTAAKSSDTAKIVDASLWWDSFSALLTELENASVSSETPPDLGRKLKDNHSWFLDTVSQFKPPNQKSREALDSPRVKVGPHELNIQPKLKDAALKISSILCLDEVQSYIISKRSLERHNATTHDLHPDIINLYVIEKLEVCNAIFSCCLFSTGECHKMNNTYAVTQCFFDSRVILEYYIERQCLLKCTRQIFMHALYFETESEGVSTVLEVAKRLTSGGLECKLLSIFEDLLSSKYPDQMDFDLYTLWAEETLIEDNLILDILFLVYCESFCACDAECWKRLCALYEGIVNGSYNFQKLAISPDAIRAIYHAKVQLMLILIQSLNLESLLQMIHDNISFRQGSLSFSEMEVQQIDSMISSFNTFEYKELGPLILAWALFLCLVSSLPEKEENNMLMEIDHIGYVRQAMEASSLRYFLDILESDTFKYSDVSNFLGYLSMTGPLAGYRSVLRTFVSAFIASYEINIQFEDENLKLILDILCKIYNGEESLCDQFWDRDSFIDGPVRCLLFNIEGEFPFRTIELLRLLSALSEGAWPSECVFNFLDKSTGLSTPFEIMNGPVVDAVSKIVETHSPLHVAGVEGLIIPGKSRGQVLRMLDDNCALVRWEESVSNFDLDIYQHSFNPLCTEKDVTSGTTFFPEHYIAYGLLSLALYLSSLQHTESGVLVLLLRLAKELYMQNPEEVIFILDLLSRLASFNTAICCTLTKSWNCSCDGDYVMGNEQSYLRIDIVEIVCVVLKNAPPSISGAIMMSMGVNILTKMLKCKPSHVASMAMKGNIFDVALRTNPFDVGSNNLSSGSWLLSGRLAKMLLIDCEQSDCSMTLSALQTFFFDFLTYHPHVVPKYSSALQDFVSVLQLYSSGVLDFTMNLLEKGLETDTVLALIVFSLQYVLINHEFWKYKVKPARWKVTQKVLEVMRKCISSISWCPKLGEVVRDIMFSDSSIHSAIFRIVCTTAPTLEVHDAKHHVSRLFDILDIEGLELAISSGLDVLLSMIFTFSKGSSVFHEAILSMTTKPVPVITAAISFISYFRNDTIQIAGARLLSALFMADISQSYTHNNMNLGLDDKQVAHFRKSITSILFQQSPSSEDLIIAILRFLTSAASNQPAFLAAVIASKEYSNTQVQNAPEHQPKKTENESLDSLEESLLYAILQYLKDSEDLLHRKPNMLLYLLKFLKALWQGAPQFSKNLEQLKVADEFWKHLTRSLVLIAHRDNISEKLTEMDLQNMACECQILSNVLDILSYEIFVQKKLRHAASVANRISTSPPNGAEKTEHNFKKNGSLKETISTWCKTSVLSDLIKVCVSSEYDESSHTRAKVAAGSFAVHVMVKLRSGDSGSLSVSLIERISALSEKLFKLPAFSDLLTQYTERSYSGGQELENLILSDLFYHIQGELNGRQIDNGPFKELLQFLIDSRFLDAYKYARDDDLPANVKSVYLYDTVRLKTDLGLEMWDLLAWKESKDLVETMLLSLQDVNSRMLHSTSKHSALRGLVTLLYMRQNNDEDLTGLKISEQVVSSGIDHICQSIHASMASLTPAGDASVDIVLDILTAQAELLLLLLRSVETKLSQPDRVLILKASSYGLKVLSGCRLTLAAETATRFLLILILSVKLTCKDSGLGYSTETESTEVSSEVSYSSLGLLPVLCSIQHPDNCILSLAAIDFILKGFSTPATWFPIIQKHFPLPHIVQKLQDAAASKMVPIILKFLLNLARVRQGAEMLLNAGILASLRMLLSDFPDGGPLSVIQSESILANIDKTEKSQPIWGLSLAVLTSIIHSLGDNSASVVDYVMACILIEKAPSVFYYLTAPDLPTNGHENKRARALKSNTSLDELKATQNTLALICVLAEHSNSWKKNLQSMESQLREKSIHLLAFISRATQHPGESPRREAPLSCHPVLKEELELFKKPSFVNSKKGWFALSALGCKSNHSLSLLSSKSTALILRDQSNENINSSHQTHLSDLIAIEMYKTAFLLLKFLCTQTEAAARKAEEVGFVDIANFPELPMPDILHGLQDQGIAIITELCEANKTKQVASEIEEVCTLLLQVTVMALYLEYSVIQICGIRPVLGHVETFSKELRLLIRATEGHVFLKEPLTILKQIVAVVYPELVHQDALPSSCYLEASITRDIVRSSHLKLNKTWLETSVSAFKHRVNHNGSESSSSLSFSHLSTCLALDFIELL